MTFVKRLLDMFRSPTPAKDVVAEDVFTVRLNKMQARSRIAPRHSAFKNCRLRPAV